MKTFDNFIEDMETNKELIQKANVLLTNCSNEETKIELTVQFAIENGYDVTVEDFVKKEASKYELNDEELNLVTGGGKGNESCWVDYACMAAFHSCHIIDECIYEHKCDDNFK